MLDHVIRAHSARGVQVYYASQAALPLPEQGALFDVVRQDDNANTFVIASGLCSAKALAMVDMYQERGHKQVYSYRPAAAGGMASEGAPKADKALR